MICASGSAPKCPKEPKSTIMTPKGPLFRFQLQSDRPQADEVSSTREFERVHESPRDPTAHGLSTHAETLTHGARRQPIHDGLALLAPIGQELHRAPIARGANGTPNR